jgi:hypothetical protein
VKPVSTTETPSTKERKKGKSSVSIGGIRVVLEVGHRGDGEHGALWTPHPFPESFFRFFLRVSVSLW